MWRSFARAIKSKVVEMNIRCLICFCYFKRQLMIIGSIKIQAIIGAARKTLVKRMLLLKFDDILSDCISQIGVRSLIRDRNVAIVFTSKIIK